jgi:hypothetical protein
VAAAIEPSDATAERYPAGVCSKYSPPPDQKNVEVFHET